MHDGDQKEATVPQYAITTKPSGNEQTWQVDADFNTLEFHRAWHAAKDVHSPYFRSDTLITSAEKAHREQYFETKIALRIFTVKHYYKVL